MADAQFRRGDLEKAFADFTRAVELNPDLSYAYMNRGLILMLRGDDAGAQKDFERCLTIKPELKAELTARIEKVKEVRKP